MKETTETYIKNLIGPRPRDSHKGNNGRVLIIAGSEGMAGAAVMAAKAALKSGAGLVTVSISRQLFPILQTAVPEAMCMGREGILTEDLSRYDAVAVGPGIGRGESQYRMVEHLLQDYGGPLIIDADGINSLCEYGIAPSRLRMYDMQTVRGDAPLVLTPHPGEADRLLLSFRQRPVSDLGRETAARTLARLTGGIVVLKGAGTLVSMSVGQDTEIWQNPTGNPGMATGGSGDVLTGVTAALAAYSRAGGAGAPAMKLTDAVRAAVYMHGLAGDLAAARIGEIGMTAMDIADALPEAFRKIAGQ